MKKIYTLLFIVFLSSLIYGQTENERLIIKSKTNVPYLLEYSKKRGQEQREKREFAIKMANEKGWPITYTDKDGIFFALQSISDEGKPLYYVTNNINAAKSTRAYTLHNGGLLGLNIEGQGMTLFLWDGGNGRTTHQEWDGAGGNNRYTIMDGSNSPNDHAAHTAGTMIASGFDPNAKGMAPQAKLNAYEWTDDEAEVADAAANSGMLLSNHSYGYSADGIPDWQFGAYNDIARGWDVIMANAPYYLMISSAGNDGNNDAANGEPLEGNSAYQKINNAKCAKNNLVVANGQDANIDVNGNLVAVLISSSSSEGPTDDYRIKPDITGNGNGVYSVFSGGDATYGNMSGTSMAAPGVCGTLMLLQQYHNSLYGSFMRAATLKGLALHTADDAGSAGPDPIYGWGLINAKKAAQTIQKKGTETIIKELTLNNGQSYTLDIGATGAEDLIVSISWTDPAGVARNNVINDPNPALINDLDIRLTKDAVTYFPYRLKSLLENELADNTVDPYEKVKISGASGTYRITVTHKGNLTNASQNFSLIVTGGNDIPPATVTNIVPNSGTIYRDGGKNIIITGTNLLNASVTVGGVPARILSNSATQIEIECAGGNYVGNNVVVTCPQPNSVVTTATTFAYSTRNTIPVGGGIDGHSTIQWGLDGLFGWWGTTTFDAAKTIEVYAGTYAEEIIVPATLAPTSANRLIIQNCSGNVVNVNATGKNYGLNLQTVNFVKLSGFTVYGAANANIYTEGDNNEISYNKVYGATAGSGIKLNGSLTSSFENNLIFENKYGIEILSSNTSKIKNNTLYNNGWVEAGGTSTIYTQGFNASTIPAGWATDILNNPSGTAPALTYVASNTNPTISAPYEGTFFVKFNSYTCEAGDEIRLRQSTSITTTGLSNVNVNFAWYQDNGYSTNADAVTVQWSTNGAAWNNASTYTRYNAVNGWSLKTCALPAGAENQPTLYIAFKFHSEYGNNCSIDGITVTGNNPPVEAGAGLYIQSGTSTSVQNNIFYAKNGTSYYALQTANGISIDNASGYNNFFANGNTNFIKHNGTDYSDLAIWNATTQGNNDINSDPQFVNAGTDFHIKSTQGSYQGGEWPPLTAISGAWTNDASNSPSIDAGNPADVYSAEPQGGSAINQGAYGNTVQASKSISCTPPTNAVTVVATPASICNGASSLLTYTGGTGTTYKWYATSDCSGAAIGTGTNFSVSPTTTTTYYGRWESACGNSTILSTIVTVSPTSVGGTIAGAATVCSGTNSTTLTLSGHTGTITRWEFSTDGGSTWTNIVNTTTTHTATNLTSTTVYRALVQSGACSSTYSATATITVNPLPVAPTSASATPNTITSGQSTTLTYTGGTGTTFNWYTGSCGETLIGTGNNLVVNNITATTTYYGAWINGCGISTCQSVVLTVSAATTYTVSGYLKYNNSAQTPINGASITLNGSVLPSTTTNASGYYEFTNVSNGNYTVLPNISLPWKEVTAMDITLYKKHISNETGYVLSGLKFKGGDLNVNGLISTSDLTPILQRMVLFISSFSVGDWAYTNSSVTVNNSNVSKDIQTTVYGDANTSYFGGTKAMETIIILSEGTIYANNGDNISIPVLMKTGVSKLSSVTLEIPYDTQTLDITNVTMANSNEDMFYYIQDGVIRLVYSTLSGANYSVNDKLLTISATVKNLTSETSVVGAVKGEFGDYDNNLLSNISLSLPKVVYSNSTDLPVSKSDISVYPNPASTFINITNVENSRIEIYNTLGEKVQSEKTNSKLAKININGLATGIYFVRIYKNKEVIVKILTKD